MLHGVEWVVYDFAAKPERFKCRRCKASVNVPIEASTFGALVRVGCDFAREHKKCGKPQTTTPPPAFAGEGVEPDEP